MLKDAVHAVNVMWGLAGRAGYGSCAMYLLDHGDSVLERAFGRAGLRTWPSLPLLPAALLALCNFKWY